MRLLPLRSAPQVGDACSATHYIVSIYHLAYKRISVSIAPIVKYEDVLQA